MKELHFEVTVEIENLDGESYLSTFGCIGESMVQVITRLEDVFRRVISVKLIEKV